MYGSPNRLAVLIDVLGGIRCPSDRGTVSKGLEFVALHGGTVLKEPELSQKEKEGCKKSQMKMVVQQTDIVAKVDQMLSTYDELSARRFGNTLSSRLAQILWR